MHKSLEIYKLPSHIEENIVNIIKLIIMALKDTEVLIKNQPLEKTLSPDNLSGELYSTFKEEL